MAAPARNVAARWDELADQVLPVQAVDALLRGAGQVFFQNNPLTGLLLLVGIFYNSASLGLGALIGLVASTLAALILGVDLALIRAGLFGFNGILVGIAFAFFMEFDLTVGLYIVVGAAISSVVMAALANLLGTYDVAPLTFPFVLTTWFFLLPVFLFTRLTPTAFADAGIPTAGPIITDLTPSADVAGAWNFVNLAHALFRGVGEVMFQDNLVTGIIFLVALAVNSRISAAMAVVGSAIGVVVAWLLGASGVAIYHGLYGFNPVLCAIAIGGVFYLITWKSALYAVFCAVLGAIFFAAFTVLLTPVGIPALTAPFVVATWLFLFPKNIFQVLHPIPLAEVSSPEINRNRVLRGEPAVSGPESPAAQAT